MPENREVKNEVKIRLTDEQHAAILRIKKQTGDTIAVIVRRYVREGLEREEGGGGRKTSTRYFFIARIAENAG